MGNCSQQAVNNYRTLAADVGATIGSPSAITAITVGDADEGEWYRRISSDHAGVTHAESLTLGRSNADQERTFSEAVFGSLLVYIET